MNDHSGASTSLASKLDALLVRLDRGHLKEGSLERLTAGASQETWSFDAVGSAGVVPLIMRRLSADAAPGERSVSSECEALLIRRAGECGVPTPGICHILEPNDDLGRGFVSDRIEGETLGRRILRNPEFAPVRAAARLSMRRDPGAHPCGAHGSSAAPEDAVRGRPARRA